MSFTGTGRRKLNVTPKYEVIDYASGKMVTMSESALLFSRIHPAIKQYGHNRNGEKEKYLYVSHSATRLVFGTCDPHALDVQFRKFVEIKDRVLGYDLTTGDKGALALSAEDIREIGRSQSAEENDYSWRENRRKAEADDMTQVMNRTDNRSEDTRVS